MHALGAVCLVLLAFYLSRDYFAAALSGAIFAFYPPALSLVDGGYSEPAFVVFAAAGLLLVFQTGWKQFLGALLLGASVLVRSNLLILPFLFALFAEASDKSTRQHWKHFCLLTLIFLIPASLWIARNYLVSGAFPMLTGADGETLYGGNNPVVASEMAFWGNWVFADQVPGETPERVLAQTMSEKQVDHYYLNQGLAFMRHHLLAYPPPGDRKTHSKFHPCTLDPQRILLFRFLRPPCSLCGRLLGVASSRHQGPAIHALSGRGPCHHCHHHGHLLRHFSLHLLPGDFPHHRGRHSVGKRLAWTAAPQLIGATLALSRGTARAS